MAAPSKKKKKYISQREFAKSIGVTHVAVIAAMDDGRLQKGIYVHPKTRHRKILPKIALKEWEANYDPKFEHARDARKKGSQAADKRNGSSEEKTTLNSLRITKEKINIQKLAIDLKVQKSELVDKAEVYKALFEFGKMFKDQLVVIPDRIVDQVMAAKSRNKAHSIIKDAIEDALRGLAAGVNIENTNK